MLWSVRIVNCQIVFLLLLMLILMLFYFKIGKYGMYYANLHCYIDVYLTQTVTVLRLLVKPGDRHFVCRRRSW